MIVYSRDQLCSFNLDSYTLRRRTRKTLFKYGIWLTAKDHLGSKRDSRNVVTSSDVNNDTRKQPNIGVVLQVECPDDLSSTQDGDDSVPRLETETLESGKLLSFGLLNANLVGSKFTAISTEINDRKLDICLLTETHHVSNRDTSLRRCVPSNNSLHDVPRPFEGEGRNFGGVAAIVNSDLKYHVIKSSCKPTTFESMAFTVGDRTSAVAVLLIYRPGLQQVTDLFYKELANHLETLALYKCQIILAGDLNIRLERDDDGDAIRLLDLLASFDCIHHIKQPTHTRGEHSIMSSLVVKIM